MNDLFLVENFNVKFNDITQVIGMGGPWVGNCTINEKKLVGLYVVEKPVLSSDRKFLGIASYHPKSKFWQDTYFKLILIDTNSFTEYEYPKEFKALCIDKIEGEIIVLYESFHKDLEKFRTSMIFKLEDFKPIEK